MPPPGLSRAASNRALVVRGVAARLKLLVEEPLIGMDLRWSDNADVRIEFTLDCSDLDRMATFWAAAADLVVEGVIEGRYVALSGHGVTLTLQRVAEPKTVKNRMHLDLLVDDLEQAVGRLETLGAARLTTTARQEFGQRWYVLADPEGNEFCVAKEPRADD